MNSASTDYSKVFLGLCPAILQRAPYGLIVCNEQGDISFANQLATFIFQQNNLIEGNLLSILRKTANFKIIWESLLSGERKEATLTLSTNQNSPSNNKNDPHLSLQVSLLKETLNKENYFLVFIDDLSIGETLNAADQYYTDSLENLVEEKSKELDFVQEQLVLSEKKAAMIETAGAVAHELRQPMTAIIGTIELLNLDNDIENDTHLNKRLETIRTQCLRMAETIKQMEQLVEYKTRPYVNGSLIIDLEKSSQIK